MGKPASLGIDEDTKAHFDELKAQTEKARSKGLASHVTITAGEFLETLLVTYQSVQEGMKKP